MHIFRTGVERESTFQICEQRAGGGGSPVNGLEMKITLEPDYGMIYVIPETPRYGV